MARKHPEVFVNGQPLSGRQIDEIRRCIRLVETREHRFWSEWDSQKEPAMARRKKQMILLKLFKPTKE